jgi:hypothetical protein
MGVEEQSFLKLRSNAERWKMWFFLLWASIKSTIKAVADKSGWFGVRASEGL